MPDRLAPILVLAWACACDARAAPATSAPAAEPTVSVRVEPDIDREALGPRYAIPIRAADPWRGASEAPVTVVVFLDYGEASSASLATDLERLFGLLGDELRVVIKPYTRALGSDERYVARAVLAASRQDRGWLMHGRIAAREGGIKRAEAMELAAEIGVPDLRAFGRDIDDQAGLDQNLELARRFGVTPSARVFINGAAYSGLDDFSALLGAFEAEAAIAERLLAAGVSTDRIYAAIIDGGIEQRAAIIEYAPPFDGEAIAIESLASGLEVEIFARGDGELVTDDNVVWIAFSGYNTVDGRLVMGSREQPAKIVVDQRREDDPIAQAFIDSVRGREVGTALRLRIPASRIPDESSARLHGGGLVVTIEIVDRAPRAPLAGVDAFTGKPRKTKIRPDGLEIYDYVSGQGRAAKAGDEVTVHYIGQLDDGTEFDSSHHRADPLTATAEGPETIPGFSQALVGARVGMLRKVVIPPALAYKDVDKGKIPANSTLTFYLEIMQVSETEEQ